MSFYINNFRSLVDFTVNTFGDTTIFFGENNAGKSNVLHALYTIFKRKKKEGDNKVQNFYEGIIENFSNNFFENRTDEIDFRVEVEIKKEELNIDKNLQPFLIIRQNNIFTISGKITKQNHDIASINTNEILFNGAILYLNTTTLSYFPDIKEKTIEQGLLSSYFTSLIEPLNDCITIINSQRDMYNTSFGMDDIDVIESSSFKNFLHTLYLSEENYHFFETINTIFNTEPFRFGELSFSRQNKLLEIMVKENGIRLPIKHLGSGVLQTLFIITSIIYSKHKIICVEELEQNLSPDKQRLILAKLQSLVNVEQIGDLQQIILSSHSPVFANNRKGLVYYLEKQNEHTIIAGTKAPNEKIKSKNLKDYFSSSVLPLNTYTKKEMEEKINKNMEDEERIFRR